MMLGAMRGRGLTARHGLAAFLAAGVALAGASLTAAAETPQLEALVKAAQQEGALVLDGPPIDLVREGITAGFGKRYGITVSYISSGSSKSGARVRAERAAGRYLLDVFVSGSDTPTLTFLPSGWLDRIEPVLIDPEVTDASKWREGHLWFVDPDRTILRVFGYVTPTVAINTKFVKPEEVATWQQLLDPKWRGKIIAKDPTVSGAGATLISYFYLNFGPSFVEKLYKTQKPFVSRDARQAVQSLAQGNFPIWVGPDQTETTRFREMGYPIQYVLPSDGPSVITGGWGIVCLVNKAPHPNAAKLFVNWLASREGQAIFAKAASSVSLRNDIVQDWAEDFAVPVEGKKYLDAYDYKFITEQRDPAFEKVQSLLDF
jgi:iron(III) transport system substrate-binding protein